MEQKQKEKGQSIYNNLNSVSGNRYNASKAKFYLTRLRQELGISEQRLIISLILDGFEINRDIESVREAIRKEWQQQQLETGND